MHGEFPSHQCLAIHLENEQKVYFEAEDSPESLISREPKETTDRKSTRLNSSHSGESRMPSSA